jgi:methyltransferase (TIGR00027 family)
VSALAERGGRRGGRLRGGRASRTAEFAALFRAGTMNFPAEQRPLDDVYARHFVRSPYLRSFMKSPRLNRRTGFMTNNYYRGIIGQTVLRARYADDALRAASTDGIDQAVMLGSGFDSTSARLSDPALRFYEVDHPKTQALKRTVLAEHAHAAALERIEFVPCDFNSERPGERLLDHGFDRERPAFVNWLAVSWYIPREAVEATLRDIASITAPGSRLVFDHLHADTAAGTSPDVGARRAYRRSRRAREYWEFGIDPGEVPDWLHCFGFEADEQMSGRDLDDRYFPDGNPMYSAAYISHVLATRT